MRYTRLQLTHSRWVREVLSECGHEVLTANARKLALISKSLKKNDRIDAQTLAWLARLDPNLLSAIRHRGASAQADLAVIRARDALVKVRTGLVNHVHFARSRDVGAYLGLTPRCGQSGAHDPQLGITMARAPCPYTHWGQQSGSPAFGR